MHLPTNRAPRKRPEIASDGDHWRADLRGLGFGRYRVALRAECDREEATHRAYELLGRLRREGMAEIAQQELPIGAPELFTSAVDRYEAERHFDSDGGRAWFREHAGLVRRELGALRLAQFAPPDGNARMAAYVRDLKDAGAGGRTIRNRISVVEGAIRHAVERGWLPAAPLHPRMPPNAAPVFDYLTEENFRALREAIYRGRDGTRGDLRGCSPAEPPLVYIARRRVYLSWLFYTGEHTADAGNVTADRLFLDGKIYQRHNAKSARCVPDERFEMPEPLYADLCELRDLLGRPFYPGEPFTGGPWHSVCRVLTRSALRCATAFPGFPVKVNPRIFRRSYAREMFLLDYTVAQVADRMGHVSDRMLREIYARTPRPTGRVESRWKIAPRNAPHAPGGGVARVLRIGGGK